MIVKKRFPSFFSGYEADKTIHEVSTHDELMEINWVKDKVKIPGHIGIFYSKIHLNDTPYYLMALSKSDKEIIYSVIGYVYGDAALLGLTDYTDYIKKYNSTK